MEHQPLSDSPQPFPAAQRQWWAGMCKGAPYLRSQAFLSALRELESPSNPGHSILALSFVREKLHDREPALIVETMEALYPGFWDGFPGNDPSKYVGRAIRGFLFLGRAAYGKPELRVGEVGESSEEGAPSPAAPQRVATLFDDGTWEKGD